MRRSRPRRRAKSSDVDLETPVALDIESLGAHGDGISRLGDRTVYVAGALPGEHVSARLTGRVEGGLLAEIIAIETPSPARRAPPCSHYAACGGCSAQHIDPTGYRAWKRQRVVDALCRRGFVDPPVADVVTTAQATRRRATLVADVAADRARVGFHQRRSHAIADIPDCLVLAPEIVALAELLRARLPTLVDDRRTLALRVQLTRTGLDLTVRAGRAPSLEERQAFAAFAESADLARVSWDHDDDLDLIAQRRAPSVRFAGVTVVVPAGAFLQASAEGEAAIVAAVRAGLGDARRVADLFAGCGSLSFAIAETAAVHAIDSDTPMIAALARAAGRADAGAVTSEVRNLFHRPLELKELARFDAVVFDPPRAGARAQAERLAAAQVSTVVAVSCEPATFARDARILDDGGYALQSVTPIDQFLWSAAVETVAVFRRARSRTPSRSRRRRG